jgi:hypothetical protein
MDPTPVLIGLDIGLVVALVYVLDPNLIRYVDLFIQATKVRFQLWIYQGLFRIRIWYDKQSLRPGPVGQFLRDQQLKSIQRNPAYREFFRKDDDQVQP